MSTGVSASTLRVPSRGPESTMSRACCCAAVRIRLLMSREIVTSRVDSRYSSSGKMCGCLRLPWRVSRAHSRDSSRTLSQQAAPVPWEFRCGEVPEVRALEKPQNDRDPSRLKRKRTTLLTDRPPPTALCRTGYCARATAPSRVHCVDSAYTAVRCRSRARTRTGSGAGAFAAPRSLACSRATSRSGRE